MQQHAYITSLGACLPNAPITNDQIDQVLGSIDQQSPAVKRRVLMNNGIATRYYAVDPATGAMTHNNVALTVQAIRNLRRGDRFTAAEIQCLACGTSSPDQLIPSHASMVHAAVDCPPCEVICTAGVCCSGLSALKYGFLNVASGLSKNAVVTGSELASPSLRASHFDCQVSHSETELNKKPQLAFSDQFLRWMLSDGAGAMWVSAKPNADQLSLRIDWIELISFANESDVCMYCGMRKTDDGQAASYRIVDDGQTLFREGYLNLAQDVAVLQDRLPRLMSQAIERTIAKRELVADHIDWLLPHYSSEWFRQKLYDGLVDLQFEIPWERWFSNLSTKGNTGAASIFIMLEELVASGNVKSGQRLLCLVPESARMTFALVHLTAV